MGSDRTKFALCITFTFVIFVVFVAFGYMSGTNDYPEIFPKDSLDVYDKEITWMSPVKSTFGIYTVVFVWQLLWLLYLMFSICRGGDGVEILSGYFYLFFIISLVFEFGYLLSWTRDNVVASFVLLVFNQIFMEVTVYSSCSSLHNCVKYNSHDSNKVDVWCQRLLVQNGVLFYAAWMAYTMMMTTAFLLVDEVGTSSQTASLVCLSILLILSIAWFCIENFWFKGYTDYTFSAYIALIWGLSGTVAHCVNDNAPDNVKGLAIALLVLSVIMLIARIILIIVNSRKRTSYENIGYNSESGALRT